jgi:hypothetical protein
LKWPEAPRIKEDAMKIRISLGLILASGLALAVGGCSQESASNTSTGQAYAPQPGASVGTAVTSNKAENNVNRQFSLAVKCPGVHYLKKKGWTNQQIMQQMQLMEDQIGACEVWSANQPKGFVPPPPPGTAAAGTPPPASNTTKTQ